MSRTEEGAALHDVAKSERSAAPESARVETSRRHGPARHETQTTCAIGGRGFVRVRCHACQPKANARTKSLAGRSASIAQAQDSNVLVCHNSIILPPRRFYLYFKM